ncbi:MAG: 3-phosphoshikimate 1-carboxyvinyltransferase, partial [Microcystis sp. M49629_WE12]|nr:3-phosphoshikimate 1-carboxyvinyltransferase [Microcystis sp. M49629_WE12]
MSIVTLNPLQSHQDLVIDPAKITGLRGKITIPGDKSISHRSLMLGAIAEGETVIHGLLLGEDPRSTASCFRAMGVEISQLNSEKVIVKGRGLGNLEEPLEILDAGNSGTTIRLMLGLLAGHQDRFFVVTGDASLRSRPMSRVVKPLKEMGAQIWGRKANSLAPLAVSGESLQPIHYYSPVASAQVKSCLLLAGLLTEGKTTITEPALSRDHSERMLRAFGANIEVDGETNSVTVTGYPT